ncbi:MAG TPA: SDR family oxidoreductase [Patescibacteria group bacterium]|nr:SDR family oxidoreductase [Patescibacteria group bacterium]
MTRSLILGGTKGLGRALAIASLERGIVPVVFGRSAATAEGDPALAGADLRPADLTNPRALENLPPGVYEGVAYVFWVAGAFLRKPLTECGTDEIAAMADLHFTGPLCALATIHRMMKLAWPLSDSPGRPYHLVTVASTSSWRLREHETVYCALKAAKAHFTRNFARELAADLPGSKTALVNPGGMKTPNFWNLRQDTSGFMEPAAVAGIIWSRALAQAASYDEYSIMREPDGAPRIEEGVRMPEIPR